MNHYSVHLYNTVHHLYFDLKTLGISGKERKQKSDNSFHTRSLKVKQQNDRETKIMPLTLSCLSWLLTSGVKGASFSLPRASDTRRKPWRVPSLPCPRCWPPPPCTAPALRLPSVVPTSACSSLAFCLNLPKCVMPPSQLMHADLLGAETQLIKGFLQGPRGGGSREQHQGAPGFLFLRLEAPMRWHQWARQTLARASLSSKEPRPDAVQGSPCIHLTFWPQCSHLQNGACRWS